MSFIDSIFEKAKANLRTIAIPEYDNDYMIKAAVKAHQDKIANILLVGLTAEIQKKAKELNLDITEIRIADTGDEAYINALLDRYAAMQEKVMPKSFIAKRISSPLHFALLIEAVGDADGTIAGVKQYAPLYQGFRLPILDCSRSDTDVTLYNNIALLSVLSANKQS